MNSTGSPSPGWYQAEADPPGTERYWDGSVWTNESRLSGTPFSLPDLVQGAPQGQHFIESNLAGLGNRVGARALDVIVWFIIGLILQAPLFFIVGSEAVDAQVEGVRLPLWVSLVQVGAAVVQLAVIVAYEALLTKMYTSTLGKKVTSTKIVKLDGSPLTFVDHIKRLSPYIVVVLIGTITSSFVPQDPAIVVVLSIVIAAVQFLIGVAGIAMVASDDSEQALWDKISKTTVIHNR